ncbi:MAG: hypothetical protein U1F71_19445 [Verrucomicrobiaceae bacterium]
MLPTSREAVNLSGRQRKARLRVDFEDEIHIPGEAFQLTLFSDDFEFTLNGINLS